MIEITDAEIRQMLNDIEYYQEKNTELQTEIAELKAHINVLRKTLNSFDINDSTGLQTLWVTNMSAEQIDQVLATTPAQSLQAHDNEVIEKCASVCENLSMSTSIAALISSGYAEAIRALKGETS